MAIEHDGPPNGYDVIVEDFQEIGSDVRSVRPNTQMRQKIAAGFGWQAANSVSRQALQFLKGIILARLLLPSDFGVISVASLTMMWIGILEDVGVGAALIQRKELTQDDVNTAHWVTGAVGLFSGACLLLVAPWVSNFYESVELVAVLQVYSVSFLLGGLTAVPGALLRRTMDFRRVSVVEITGTFVSGLASVLMVGQGLGVLGIPMGSAAGLLASLILYGYMGLWKVNGLPSRRGLKNLAGFSAFASGARMAGLMRINIDNATIGKILGTSALGFYAFSYNLSAVVEYRLVGLITTIAFPALASLQSDLSTIRKAYLNMLKYTAAAVFPLLTGLILVADRVIPLVYGQKWMPAVPVLQVLCLCGAGCSIAELTSSPLLAMGHAKWIFRMNLVWVCLLAAGLGGVFALGFGLLEAAWAVSGAALLAAVMRNGITSRLCRASGGELWRALSPALIGLTAMVPSVLLFQRVVGWEEADAIAVLGAIVLGAITYLAATYWHLPELRFLLVNVVRAKR